MEYFKGLYINDQNNRTRETTNKNSFAAAAQGKKSFMALDTLSLLDTKASFQNKIKASFLDKISEEITFTDISQSFTGLARIIKYHAIYGDCFSKDLSLLKVHLIEEGEFVSGKKNGYCRVMNGRENTIEFGMF